MFDDMSTCCWRCHTCRVLRMKASVTCIQCASWMSPMQVLQAAART